MLNNFSELGVSPEILKAIEEMGFVDPTEVQDKAIPPILNHQDVIVMSKTGSGKTAVFGIPMLQLIAPDEEGPQGLILTPTRELAVQIDSDLKQISKYLPHQTTVVYGQHSMNVEVQALKKGASIVTGTPGRVYDHLQQGNLVTKHIRFLVLDEADRMLDMGFYGQVIRIVKALPRNRITLLFSATIPLEVQRISRDFMNNPIMIEIESPTMTVDTIRQIYYRVYRDEKRTQLNRILLTELPESCMIFCNTRAAVDHVQSFLSRKGYAVESLHGDIPQVKRMKTIEQFKKGVFHILVATDVAARGLHIDNLSLVINYDVPLERDGYIHRIGRTGRAGNEGLAITLATGDDIMSLYEIEEHTGAMIEEADLPEEIRTPEHKEKTEKWLLSNAGKPVADAEPADRAPSEPRNARGKSTRTSAASSGQRSKPGSFRESGVSAKPRTERSKTGNSRTANANAALQPIVPEKSTVQPSVPSNITASDSAKPLQTMRKPHVRIVGESDGAKPSGIDKPKTPAVSAVKSPPVSDPGASQKEMADEKSGSTRIWNRLFHKKGQ